MASKAESPSGATRPHSAVLPGDEDVPVQDRSAPSTWLKTPGYGRRLHTWFFLFGAPAAIAFALLTFLWTNSGWDAAAVFLVLTALLWLLARRILSELVRPLQTLVNIIGGLRKDDFTLRARGARRGDALGELALEINELASSMQQQRTAARDALTLIERVLSSMQTPVLAFDSNGLLRLFNPAAEQAFALSRSSSAGRPADELGLANLLAAADEGRFDSSEPNSPETFVSARWIVRRTLFRLNGLPHTLFVLSNIDQALREQERLAWQRLIRVLSHEINNSLTPIKSIAGSLLSRLPQPVEGNGSAVNDNLRKGLSLIENRAESLNRFLHAYQELTHLPKPTLRCLHLGPVLERTVLLETRLEVRLHPGPSLQILGDEDQLQQLMINIIRNAVESAVTAAETAQVHVTWLLAGTSVLVQVRDNGPGLLNAANLFVPFYTTKPEGSGIGLVLAQQIASGHHGALLLFNNNDGPGCTCEVRLPLHTEIATRHAEPAMAATASRI